MTLHSEWTVFNPISGREIPASLVTESMRGRSYTFHARGDTERCVHHALDNMQHEMPLPYRIKSRTTFDGNTVVKVDLGSDITILPRNMPAFLSRLFAIPQRHHYNSDLEAENLADSILACLGLGADDRPCRNKRYESGQWPLIGDIIECLPGYGKYARDFVLHEMRHYELTGFRSDYFVHVDHSDCAFSLDRFTFISRGDLP